ncbi:MAG: M15 family metallopeptidase [Actinomycetales bacterium]|nr:M15 family metallopeptidase [Actinomycetales bacterium]
MAFDYVGSDPSRNPWDGSLPWAELGAIYQAHDCTWGGDWDSDGDRRDQKFHDLVHGQLNGFSVQDLQLGVLANVIDEEELEWLSWWLEEIAGSKVYVACMQRIVTRLGFDPGPIDGLWGAKTAQGLSSFAAARDLRIPVSSKRVLLGADVRQAVLCALGVEIA